MYKVLVTGSAGLLGSYIEGDYKLTRQDCDLLNFEDTKKKFLELQPTHVIHTAGVVGGIVGNLNHMGKFYHDNMRINLNVLESCRLANVQKVLTTLSTCIYNPHLPQPFKEQDLHKGSPHPGHFGYAYSKRMVDIQNQTYYLQYGKKYSGVILPNMCGPGDSFDLENGHLIPSLLLKAYEAKTFGKPLIVWGTGIARREILYVKDVAQILNKLIFIYDEVEPINISPGFDYSIKEIVDTIVSTLDLDIEVIYDSSKPDGQITKRTDNSKLLKYLPEITWTPLSEGLKETFKWIEENYPNIRGLNK